MSINTSIMHNVYLFNSQYKIKHLDKVNYWLPYSVGCLWSYAYQYDDIRENFKLGELFFKRDPHEEVLEKLDNPAICGFSSYIWNHQYNVILAEKIRKKFPECKIIFGGPNVNAKTLQDHDYIDSIVLTEGEESFLKILRQFLKNEKLDKVYNGVRIKNLDIPSPYTSGVFDKIIADNPTVNWQMTLETNRGCPYACTFCDWGGVTYSKIFQFNFERVVDEIKWAASQNVSYITFADANFGIFKDRDLEIAKKLTEILNDSNVQSLNIQFAKNSNETIIEIARILDKKLRGLTVSVQSMHDQTLKDIKRVNMDISSIKNVMDLSKEKSVPTYSEIILGLPSETVDTFKNGLCNLIEAGQHNSIDIWFAQLFPNSELSHPSTREKYQIKTVVAEDYVSLYNSGDLDPYTEIVELISATSTMTTNDMVESYMYGWMIIQFHTSGYTQLYAQYMYELESMPYREFYDLLYKEIQKNPILGEHFIEVRQIVSHYLHTGKMINPEKVKGHAIHAMSSKFLYDNKELIYKVARKVVEEYTFDATDIYNLQKHFIYDSNVVYPEIVHDAWIDIESWEPKQASYIIESRVDKNKNFEFYSSRRSGVLKNKIVKMDLRR